MQFNSIGTSINPQEERELTHIECLPQNRAVYFPLNVHLILRRGAANTPFQGIRKSMVEFKKLCLAVGKGFFPEPSKHHIERKEKEKHHIDFRL